MIRPLRLLCLTWLLVLSTGCGRPPEPPLQVATCVWPGYEPLFLARQLGALDAKTCRLLQMPTTSDCIRAFQSGRVSAAAMTLDEAFTVLQDGVDLQVVLVMDVSHGADVLLGGPKVHTLADLKGRRVGLETSAVGAYLLSRALDKAGLGPEDIHVVPLSEGAHVAAYRNGTVDALVTLEPVRTRLLGEGARILFDSSQIPNEIFDVLVVRGSVARQRPEAVAQLREAWFRALAYLRAQPREAARRMAPREGQEPEAFLRTLDGLAFPDARAEARMRGGELLPPARRLADLMLKKGLLRRPVDPARLFPGPGRP
ncbi:hypothetical protein GETHLI_28640 [Geothrix limicola]|uniref:Uncharacterized protein n=1 Tax=Geothrix limicola TaxID=2927978 RepID=A0ABQ5QHN3_9BACT|nr:ABC transporter substrate-binding protein [Geothrix limicola]GLH74362.1 hypothetical protein GETHLI_28640 [Geothrix limicola]